jgi:hypothetical protein
MKKPESAGLAAIFFLTSALAWAGDFDGSKTLVCATMEAHECDPGLACERARPTDVGAPRFLSIDFARKTIAGPVRSTPIVSMTKGPNQILMQGTELGYAWTVALDTGDGEITMMLANRDDALVIFGDCTAM